MFRRTHVITCAICLGIGFLGVVNSLLPVLPDAEEQLGLHLLYRLRGPEKPRTGVIVMAIDRKSAKALDLPAAPHKWPHALHARLLDALTASEAAVVAFDLIFHEPQFFDNDHAFATAIRKVGNVILTQPIDKETMPLLDPNGMPISRMTIEKRVSAVPLLADAAIAQTPFPLPKVPIKLNRYWRFGPGTTEQPTLPVVVMHAFANILDEKGIHSFKTHKGIILQVVGDSVLAIWSVPKPDNRLKTAAGKAAMGIHRAVQQFNAIDDSGGPSKFYRQLCEELRQVPPNSDWNGAVC